MPIPENGVTLDTHKEATKHRSADTFALGLDYTTDYYHESEKRAPEQDM
jgi:hypothetical protein